MGNTRALGADGEVYNWRCIPNLRPDDGGLGHRRHAGGRDHRLATGVAADESARFLNFGRLRPFHTNAVIFCVRRLRVVCILILRGSTHVAYATVRAKLADSLLGLAAVIVLAAITFPLGMTSSKGIRELEWPIDILIAVVRVSYAVCFRHGRETQDITHLRCQLVFRRISS